MIIYSCVRARFDYDFMLVEAFSTQSSRIIDECIITSCCVQVRSGQHSLPIAMPRQQHATRRTVISRRLESPFYAALRRHSGAFRSAHRLPSGRLLSNALSAKTKNELTLYRLLDVGKILTPDRFLLIHMFNLAFFRHDLSDSPSLTWLFRLDFRLDSRYSILDFKWPSMYITLSEKMFLDRMNEWFIGQQRTSNTYLKETKNL